MQLYFFDILFFQLFIFPLYFLFIFSYFLFQTHRRTLLLNTSIRLSCDHIVVYSFKHIAVLIIPFFILIFLLISSVRGVEQFFCVSQLYLTENILKYFYFYFFFTVVTLLIFSGLLFKSTLPFIFEIIISILWLFFCFYWIFLITNLIIFLFFLEILGLLLIIILLYIFIITKRQVLLINLNYKLFHNTYASKFLFIQTLLFFLWSSAISMLLLFWSCFFIIINCLSTEFTLIELFYIFNIQILPTYNINTYYILFFFFFAVLLKGAIIPLQAWLIIFYRHLPIFGLFAYLLFYYIYFILILFNLLFSYLYIFNVIWFNAAIILFSISIFYIVLNLGEAVLFRNFIAYSSIINLFLLFAYMLVL